MRRQAHEPSTTGRPSRLRLPIAIGVVIVAVFVGGFGVWAAFTPLQTAAIAPGVVSVDTYRKTVKHLEGGIADEILVREGDYVTAGQVLIRLDETRPRASVEAARGQYRALTALAARLLAERDGLDAIAFPDWLLDELDSPEIVELVSDQMNIFEARRQSLAGQVAILEQRIAGYAEEIRGLEGEIESEEVQLELLDEEIDAVGRLVEKKLATRPRLLALERRKAEITGSRSRNLATIARARQNIAEGRLQIADLKTTGMNRVVQELSDARTELWELSEIIRATEDVLRRTAIRAPLDGTIVGLNVHTLGGVIGAGEPLMDIVPSGDRLVIDAQVSPDDIDVLHPGLPAKIHLTALSRRSTLPLDGRVTSISADGLVDQRTGNSYYLARIEVTGDPAGVLDSTALYPGMQAEVMIVTGSRTAIDYLVAPITRSIRRAFREN